MTATVEIMPPGADLFASGCEALVNPVNCVGVSGKGLALEFKRRFPATVGSYAYYCNCGYMRPGRAAGFATMQRLPLLIIFAATKNHWRDPSKLEWIASAMTDIEEIVSEQGIDSIGIPALGAGNGGLPWSQVEPLILAAAERMRAAGCSVKVYPPHEVRK